MQNVDCERLLKVAASHNNNLKAGMFFLPPTTNRRRTANNIRTKGPAPLLVADLPLLSRTTSVSRSQHRTTGSALCSRESILEDHEQHLVL